jgi:hypothetical protein
MPKMPIVNGQATLRSVPFHGPPDKLQLANGQAPTGQRSSHLETIGGPQRRPDLSLDTALDEANPQHLIRLRSDGRTFGGLDPTFDQLEGREFERLGRPMDRRG